MGDVHIATVTEPETYPYVATFLFRFVQNRYSFHIIILINPWGKVNVSVLFNNETFWLSQRKMSELFAVDVSTINYHLKQINESGEVHLSEAIRKIQIPSEKWDEQGVLMYNLDVIITCWLPCEQL